MKRGPLKRTTGLARSALRRKRPPAATPQERLLRERFRTAAMVREHGRCVVTGQRADHVHHVVPQQVLKHNRDHALLWDPDNGAPLAKRVHELHEQAVLRLRLEDLPACAIVWAYAHGYGWVLQRYYA